MRIVILGPQYPGEPEIEAAVAGPDATFEIVRPALGAPVPAEPLTRADAVINCRSRHVLDAPLVDAMRDVRIVVQSGVGFNHIDGEACARRGIPVCNTPDYGTREVADHAIGLMLALIRGIVTYDQRLRARDDAWSPAALAVPPMHRLSGRTFGVVGLGRIGLATARRARAFELDVLFHDPFLPPGTELALGFRRAETLEALLADADIVSLHTPLTPRTERLIDDETVSRMKPGAVLINTSRGGTMDLDAVERGLRSGRLGAAALDVLPNEPFDPSHPLLAAWRAGEPWLEGRLLLTPHAAFYTPESLADMRRLSAFTVVDYLRHGRLRSCVNLDALRRAGHASAA